MITEKVIDILKSIKDGTACLMPNMPEDGEKAIDIAIKAVEHPEPHWHPVSEQPQEEDDYLLLTHEKFKHGTFKRIIIGAWNSATKEWLEEYGDMYREVNHPVAWISKEELLLLKGYEGDGMSFIVPMEKPKRCGLCPCFHAEHPMHCQAVKAHKDKRIIAPYGAPIPDWCPLIELPPHGRLIDVSTVEEIRFHDADGYHVINGEQLCELEIDADTVIEAEGSEK